MPKLMKFCGFGSLCTDEPLDEAGEMGEKRPTTEGDGVQGKKKSDSRVATVQENKGRLGSTKSTPGTITKGKKTNWS